MNFKLMSILEVLKYIYSTFSLPFSEVFSLTLGLLCIRYLLSFSVVYWLFFLNELFLPGKDNLTERDASNFKVKWGMDGVILEVKKTKRFGYQFLVQDAEALLKESSISLQGTPYVLRWKYADFRPLDSQLFPTDMQVLFEGGKKPVKATFALSRLSTDADWETHTEVSNRYREVNLEDILKQLLKK